MALTIPIGFGQYRHEFSLVGDPEPMFCIFGWSSEEGTVDLQAVATGIHNAGKTLQTALCVPTCTLNRTTVTFVPTSVGVTTVAEAFSPQAGGNTGDGLTQNTCYLLKKSTATGGRRGRGRAFWPGVRADQVSDAGIVTAATVASYASNLLTYLNAVKAVAGVGDMVILHDNEVGASLTFAPSPVTQLTMDSRVASQRRRLRR
jgi:hypothetical protein